MSTSNLSDRLQTLQRESSALLQRAVAEHGDVVYSTSLGIEAMVLMDLVFTYAPEIEVFTLDTGRLHPETLDLLDRVERRYKQRIAVFYPNTASVEELVSKNGINGFYIGLEERQACCAVRRISKLALTEVVQNTMQEPLRSSKATSEESIAPSAPPNWT